MKKYLSTIFLLLCISESQAGLSITIVESVSNEKESKTFIDNVQTNDISIKQLKFGHGLAVDGVNIQPSGNVNSGPAAAVADGIAEYGILKAYAETYAGGIGGGSVGLTLRFDDDLIINAAGLDGKAGKLNAFLSFNWNLLSKSLGQAFVETSGSLSFLVGQTQVQRYAVSYATYNGGDLQSFGRNEMGILVPFDFNLGITADFIFGKPFHIASSLGIVSRETMTNGLGPSKGESIADAFHSVYWDGFKSIQVNGININNFSVSAASGTDYSKSFLPTVNAPGQNVPEPASWALLTGALFALMAARRKIIK